MGGSASKAQLVPGDTKVHKVQAVRTESRVPLEDQRIAKPKIAWLSIPGFGKEEEDNEDFIATGELPCGMFYCAIFDGHGPCGRVIAETCALELPKVLKVRFPGTADEDGQKAMIAVFSDLHTAVAELDGDAADLSGAVGTIALYDPKASELHVGNVGDAKALVGGLLGECEELTVDHYCTVDEEKQRIVEAGGRVDASDDIQLGTLGEVRVWKGSEVLHTVSRAIGDLQGKKVGMLHTPSVRRFDLGSQHRFMVMCSSGVWKVMHAEGAASLVTDLMSKASELKPIVEELVEQASERWAELWQGENTSSLLLIFPNVP
mmetsp:Transcript_6925/g.21128  ORF Transcript_6925/g.21128 Transcript_6925/m.21128 type:complete len:319 (-) Transcript_6925:607-1563(-)